MGYIRAGLGDYDRSGDWSWEFFPPPYDFLAPPDSAPQPAPIMRGNRIVLPTPIVLAPKGVGDCGCGCNGAGDCHGLGLFDAGFDYTRWGAPEWTFIGVGAYLTLSLVGDLFTAGRTVKRGYRKIRPRARAEA